MRTYHFDCGDSTRGPVGLCARISSETPEEALLKLRNALAAAIGGFGEVPIRVDDPGIGYVNVYISPDNFTVADVEEEADVA